MKTVFVMIGLFVVLVIYARVAPVSAKMLDTAGQADADTDLDGGFTAVRPFDGDRADLHARIMAVALATPRTTLLSDDPLQFVTRTKVVGFPDVTTVQIRDKSIMIHAHLVIGKSDLGVNKARVLDWLDRLGPL